MTQDPRMNVLYELPDPIENLQFLRSSVRYQYPRDGAWYRGGILFKRIFATCIRAEGSVFGWQIDAYDKLVEIEDSAWARQIRAETYSGLQYRDAMNHYLIYIYDEGTFETIADSWELLPEEKGEWPRIPGT